ncbi:hypothetical protein Pcac1_g3258 [Phytophthora cactorum]|nr:hypothetical protein Pcac1_g3258 [Phytophthora cactorum]
MSSAHDAFTKVSSTSSTETTTRRGNRYMRWRVPEPSRVWHVVNREMTPSFTDTRAKDELRSSPATSRSD